MTHGCNFLQFLLPSCSRCESFGRVHIAILFMRVRSQTQTGSLRQRLRSLAGDKIHHRYWLLHSFRQYLHIDVRMEVETFPVLYSLYHKKIKLFYSDTWCHLNLSLIVFFSSLILIHMSATLYHLKCQPWQRCEYSIIVFFRQWRRFGRLTMENRPGCTTLNPLRRRWHLQGERWGTLQVSPPAFNTSTPPKKTSLSTCPAQNQS